MKSTIDARRSVAANAAVAIHGIRYRIFNVIDLPFILLTGLDKNHDRITVGELVNHQKTYHQDLVSLSRGSIKSIAIRKVLLLSLNKVQELSILVSSGQLSEKVLLSDYFKRETESIFQLSLTIQLAFALDMRSDEEASGYA